VVETKSFVSVSVVEATKFISFSVIGETSFILVVIFVKDSKDCVMKSISIVLTGKVDMLDDVETDDSVPVFNNSD